MKEAIVAWLRDYAWYWGSDATLFVVLAGFIAWVVSNLKVVSDAVTKLGKGYEKLPAAWQERLKRFAMVAWSALAPLVLAAVAGIEGYRGRWEGAVMLGAALALTAAGAMWLRERPWSLAAMQVVLLVGAMWGEQWFYQRRLQAQWSQDKVYVFLPTRATTEEKTEELQRFWREYVNAHRQVFDGVKGLRIEPKLWDGRDAVDDARVKQFDHRLDPERASAELRKAIRYVLRRETFCPAVVITSQVGFSDVAGSKTRTVRTTHEIYVESTAAPGAPLSYQWINLPTGKARLTSDDVKFLALRLAFAVVEVLPQLRCEPSPRLSDAERDGTVRQVMVLYRKFLSTASPDRQPGDLQERVGMLVARPTVTLEDARTVLDAYGVGPEESKAPAVPPRADALAEKLKNL